LGVNRNSTPACDRRLVVRAQDRSGGVPHDPVLDHRLDRGLGRHGVEMCTEEERRPSSAGRLQTRIEVSRVGPDPRTGVVLVHVDAEPSQVRRNAIGDNALLTRRARQRGELREELENVGLVGRHRRRS